MNASRPPVVVGVYRKQPAAIRYALEEAKRRGTSLRVVHCHEAQLSAAASYHGRSDFVGPIDVPADHALADAHELVQAEAPRQVVTYVDVEGETSAVLLAHADDAESVILGAAEASWFDRVLGGTVAGRIARRASCPVVVVPEQCGSTHRSGAVVVTIDGDTSAAGVLNYGFEQAQAREEVLVILHAVPLGTLRADFESHRANVAEVIAGWNELFPEVKVLVSSTVGDAVDASVSASCTASLVVMGRPHGHVHSFALARPVAMNVIRRAQCAVAIVPPDYQRDSFSGSTHDGRRSSLV